MTGTPSENVYYVFRRQASGAPLTEVGSVDAPNEDVAREHTFAEFGSKHGLKRTQVEIDEVGE